MGKPNKTLTKDQPNDNVLEVHDKAASKIDAIKQLIFGESMQEYQTEFDSVKKDILNKKKELEDLIEDVKGELLHSIDNLSTDLNIRITDLEDSLNNKLEDMDNAKVNRKTLGELLIKLGEKINQ